LELKKGFHPNFHFRNPVCVQQPGFPFFKDYRRLGDLQSYELKVMNYELVTLLLF
jgi:hypothetical protein